MKFFELEIVLRDRLVNAACVSLAALVLVTPSISFARALSPVSRVCVGEAGMAKIVAQDRDSGVNETNELMHQDHVIETVEPQDQPLAQVEFEKMVYKLYGKYAKLPPTRVYDQYLAFCLRKAADLSVMPE
jgi:hypothetical protein